MCPHTLVRMAAPVPCRFGSEASFASEEARAEAEGSYHAHEWRVARRLREAGLAPVGRLALRLVTSGIANDIESPDCVGVSCAKNVLNNAYCHSTFQRFSLKQ